jgi:hypothetical protein
MLTIQGLYDGQNFIALEEVPFHKRTKVIITFLEEPDESSEVRDLSSQTDSFLFWENEAEDIYQDYLNK